VVSSGPYNIAAGQEITLAFALHAGANLSDLKSSAKYADSVYNYTLKAAKPIAVGISTCYGKPAVLTASGASKIKWYRDFTGGTAIATGNQFTTGNLFNDTILYVSNAEKSFESVRTPIKVSVKSNPTITTSGATTFCQGQSVILSANDADSFLWSTGATTKTIEVKTAGDYSVIVKSTSLNCQATSKTVSVKVNPGPTAKFAAPASVGILATVSFTDQSTNAISWAWDFGDGNKSSLQNPTNTFKDIRDVTVKLIVTAANGCTNSVSSPISVITGQEDLASNQVFAFPNPINGQVLTVEIPSGLIPISARIVTTFGESLFAQEFSVTSEKVVLQIPVSEFPAGMYIVQIKTKDGLISKKVIKNL
jgi:PKD repeat protein